MNVREYGLVELDAAELVTTQGGSVIIVVAIAVGTAVGKWLAG